MEASAAPGYQKNVKNTPLPTRPFFMRSGNNKGRGGSSYKSDYKMQMRVRANLIGCFNGYIKLSLWLF